MTAAKATWRDYDWSTSKRPERRDDYVLFRELVLADGLVVGSVQQFAANPRCFYATTEDDRSGCCMSLDSAIGWCLRRCGLTEMMN